MQTESYVGGMRGPEGANATWPLARLTIDSDRGVTVALRWRRPRFPGLEPVRYEWNQIDRAEKVRAPIPFSPGVRFVGRNGASVVFWTWQPDAVLGRLRRHGVVTVSRSRPPRIWIRP